MCAAGRSVSIFVMLIELSAVSSVVYTAYRKAGCYMISLCDGAEAKSSTEQAGTH